MHLNLTNEQGEGRSEQHLQELIFSPCTELTPGFPEHWWAKVFSSGRRIHRNAAVTLILMRVSSSWV